MYIVSISYFQLCLVFFLFLFCARWAALGDLLDLLECLDRSVSCSWMVFLEEADLDFRLSSGFFFGDLLWDLLCSCLYDSFDVSFDFFFGWLHFFFESVPVCVGVGICFLRSQESFSRSFFFLKQCRCLRLCLLCDLINRSFWKISICFGFSVMFLSLWNTSLLLKYFSLSS